MWKRVWILEVWSENGCEKWRFLVWNRVKIWGTGRHTPTKSPQEYPLGVLHLKTWIRNMDSRSRHHPCGTLSMDPFEDPDHGLPLWTTTNSWRWIFQRSNQILGTFNDLKWRKLWSALIIRIMGSSYVTLVQIFFNSIYTTNAMSSFSLVEPQPHDE